MGCAKSRGAKRGDEAGDSQLPSSGGELLGPWEPNGEWCPQVVQGMVLGSEWSEVRSRMIPEGCALLLGVPSARVFPGAGLRAQKSLAFAVDCGGEGPS